MEHRGRICLVFLLLASVLGCVRYTAAPSHRPVRAEADFEFSWKILPACGGRAAALLVLRNESRTALDLRNVEVQWRCGRQSGTALPHWGGSPLLRPGTCRTGRILLRLPDTVSSDTLQLRLGRLRLSPAVSTKNSRWNPEKTRGFPQNPPAEAK